MGRLIKVCTKLLEAFGALALLVLTLMVFFNVVLRYGFNSSITVTEELGRYLMVWLLFVGAILAAGIDAHVRVDMFVGKLPRLPRVWVNIVCDLIMLYCCWLIVVGGYDQTILNRKNFLPVSGLPESLIYGSCLLAGILIGLILLARLAGRIASLGRPEPAAQANQTEG
ncbi:MAG: TRAP transporter small permease [Planctomycetota bacterium]|jgi:TRAP-type C4-dicarboxylate transport system permease small subunit|nr:TRAP transporter small permease [Planctomycetota bacterium]